MKGEFRDAYVNLFENSFTNLHRIIQVKQKAINYSNKHLLCIYKKNSTTKIQKYKTFTGLREQVMRDNIERLHFEPIDQLELENLSSDLCSTSKSRSYSIS